MAINYKAGDLVVRMLQRVNSKWEKVCTDACVKTDAILRVRAGQSPSAALLTLETLDGTALAGTWQATAFVPPTKAALAAAGEAPATTAPAPATTAPAPEIKDAKTLHQVLNAAAPETPPKPATAKTNGKADPEVCSETLHDLRLRLQEALNQRDAAIDKNTTLMRTVESQRDQINTLIDRNVELEKTIESHLQTIKSQAVDSNALLVDSRDHVTSLQESCASLAEEAALTTILHQSEIARLDVVREELAGVYDMLGLLINAPGVSESYRSIVENMVRRAQGGFAARLEAIHLEEATRIREIGK